MDDRIFVLGTCNTCKRILSEINCENLKVQDIKKEAITEQQLEKMYELAGSYEALFTRKSMKYRSMNLKDQTLSEEDFKKLILQEYTFLKRPVAIVNHKIFIGNSKKNVAALKAELQNAK